MRRCQLLAKLSWLPQTMNSVCSVHVTYALRKQRVFTSPWLLPGCYSSVQAGNIGSRHRAHVSRSVRQYRPAGAVQQCTTNYKQLVLMGLMGLTAAIAHYKAASIKHKS